MILTDARLMSLAALRLSAADDHLLPGTHLRWMLAPGLGLPRAGVRVRARPAPVWPWPKPEARRILLGPDEIATSTAGIHFIRHRLRAEGATLTPAFHLRATRGQPVSFTYQTREQSDPTQAPILRLALALRSEAPRSTVKLKGFARRGTQEVLVAETRARVSSLLPFSRPADSRKALFLSGNEMHRVEFTTSRDVTIEGLLYALPEDLHSLRDWQERVILPPLCAPGTPFAVAPADASALAAARLAANRPRRRGGDPKTAGAGPLWTAAEHDRFEARLARAAGPLAAQITRAFDLEATERRPPGAITLREVEGSAAGTPRPRSTAAAIDLPFHALLQAGAFAPHVAAMLGLGHHDATPPAEGPLDYAVDLLAPRLWMSLEALTAEQIAEAGLERLPPGLFLPPLAQAWAGEPPGFARVIAFALGLEATAPPPPPPPGVESAVRPRPDRPEVQAEVALRARPGALGSRSLAWRLPREEGPGEDTGDGTGEGPQGLGPIDPESGLMYPAAPGADGHTRFVDSRLPGYGPARYMLADLDVFGRMSLPRTLSVTVTDTVAPPPPAQPDYGDTAADPADATRLPAVRLTTLWSAAQDRAAPDLDAIIFVWRPGSHRASDFGPGDVASPRALRVPLGGPGARPAPSGTEFTTSATIETLRDIHRREATIVCFAQDRAGNLSEPSSAAHIVLLDEITPPAPAQPAEPLWTTWPDATGTARFTLRWEVAPGAQATRISMASEIRLLDHAGVPRAPHLAQDHRMRAAALRRLARAHPTAFSPVEIALPRSVTAHELSFQTGSDELRLLTVEFIGDTGQKAPWPDREDAFAALRIRPPARLIAPQLQVTQEPGRDLVALRAGAPGAVSALDGAVELFVITAPAQLALLDVMTPAAMLRPDAAHAQGRDPNQGWVGYTARLRAADGRVSAPSAPLWRAPRA